MSFATHEMLRDESHSTTYDSHEIGDPYKTPYTQFSGACLTPSTYSAVSPFQNTSSLVGHGVLDYKQGVTFNAPPPGPAGLPTARHTPAYESMPSSVSVMPFENGAEVTMQVVDAHDGMSTASAPQRATPSSVATVSDYKEVARKLADRLLNRASPPQAAAAESEPATMSTTDSDGLVDRIDALEQSVCGMHAGLEHHTEVLTAHSRQMRDQRTQMRNHMTQSRLQHEGLVNHTHALNVVKDQLQTHADGLENHTSALHTVKGRLQTHTDGLKSHTSALHTVKGQLQTHADGMQNHREIMASQIKEMSRVKAQSTALTQSSGLQHRVARLENDVGAHGKEMAMHGDALKQHRVAITKQHEGLLSHASRLQAAAKNPYAVDCGVASTAAADVRAMHVDLKRHSTSIARGAAGKAPVVSMTDMRAIANGLKAKKGNAK